ncbi:MAG: hypothetical protein GX216_05010 [Methanomicrobiales archaeon]|nr:hypothetical protein [Methanomicrobiales archaeon]
MPTGSTIRNTGQEPITIAGIRVSRGLDDDGMIRKVTFTCGWSDRSPHVSSDSHGHGEGGFTVFWPGEAESGQVLEG